MKLLPYITKELESLPGLCLTWSLQPYTPYTSPFRAGNSTTTKTAAWRDSLRLYSATAIVDIYICMFLKTKLFSSALKGTENLLLWRYTAQYLEPHTSGTKYEWNSCIDDRLTVKSKMAKRSYSQKKKKKKKMLTTLGETTRNKSSGSRISQLLIILFSLLIGMLLGYNIPTSRHGEPYGSYNTGFKEEKIVSKLWHYPIFAFFLFSILLSWTLTFFT